MSSIRRFFLWCRLLTKRLLRRPAYLAVLLLVPMFAAGVALLSGQESGALTVALYLENPDDPVAAATAQRLRESDSILRCLPMDSAEEAREAVRSGRADAAWLLSADLSEGIDAFVRSGKGRHITVVEREDNVFLMIARERLFTVLYPDVSFALFRSFLREDLGIRDLTEDQLREYYHSDIASGGVIRFAYVDGSELESGGNYLTAPLRGILSLLILLSGLASGMYCYREEREESFVWLPPARRRLLPVLSHILAMTPTALAVLAALALSGVWLGLGKELAAMLLYLPCCAMFCEILRCLCPREEHFGALIPLTAVAVLVFCPVFLRMNFGLAVRSLLPPGYYLNASLSLSALKPMLVYTAALIPPTVVCTRLRERFLNQRAADV